MSERVNKEAHYQKLMTGALTELKKMQTRLSEQEYRQREPIAIVGLGCRYPGGINSPEDFWQALVDQRDGIVDASNRWNMQQFYDPDPMAPGKIYSRHLGLVDNMAEFDADFFGISPREAECMDPQQRILLETSWQGLEDAGYHMNQLRGMKMGVYIGIATFDYSFLRSHAGGLETISTYDGTGNALSIAAGRLSYVFGLQGPSMAIETACSSSLVATHLAIQALRSGEIDSALAGGVNSITNPATSVMFSKGMMLSPDGRCRAFDKNGNGYVRSEGCGVVILKRLSDALRDGNHITAVIKGSAINQDGRSQGIVAPNENAQRDVIQAALKNARITPDQVDYVEAHGTGTALGDPIEVNALASVFGGGKPRKNKLRIGSVKTNIGHCETAAGVAGLIKVALSLKHKLQPAQLHFSEPNPYIPWPNIPITVASTSQDWNTPEPTAGVSSFGFSGTNAHLIMQRAPEASQPAQEATQNTAYENRLFPLTLSAHSAAALNALIDSYQSTDTKNIPFSQWCYSSNQNRGQLEHRLTVLAHNYDEAREHLDQAKQGIKNPYWVKNVCAYRKPAVAFLFAGQGPQFAGMGKALYDNLEVVRQHIDACEQHLLSLWPVKLTDVLWGDQQALLNQTQYTQAALFSLQTACAHWWMQMGVEPKRLLGHSFGEYAAAYLAGVFSLNDALTLLVARGNLPQQLSAPGAMLSIQASKDDIDPWMNEFPDQLSYAAINGPQAVVISGTSEAIANIEQRCADSLFECQRLRVSHAFHSPLMEPVLAEFRTVAQSLTYHKPVKPLISCLTGNLIQEEIANPEYWVDHLRNTVQFDQAVKTLHKAKPDMALEMGPGSTILGLVRQHLEAENLVYLPSFRQQQDALETLTNSCVQAHHQGAIKNWLPLYPVGTRYTNALPHYPFQRKIFWFKLDNHTGDYMYAFAQYAATNQVAPSQQATHMSSSSRKIAEQKPTAPMLKHKLFNNYVHHPLLNQTLFDVPLDTNRLPQLKEYKLYGEAIATRGFLLSVLYAALHYLDKEKSWQLENVEFPNLLHLNDTHAMLHVVLTQSNPGYSVELLVTHDGIKRCLLSTHANSADETRASIIDADLIAEPEQFRLKSNDLTQRKRFYEQLNEQLNMFSGSEFQWVDSVWQQDNTLLATLAMPTSVQSDDTFPLHPGLVESTFQALFAHPQWADQLTLPNRITNITWYHRAASARLNLMIKWKADAQGHAEMIVQVNDQQGKRVLDMDCVSLQPLDHNEFLRQLGNHPSGRHYQKQWINKPASDHSPEPLGCLLLVVSDEMAQHSLPPWIEDMAKQSDWVNLWVNSTNGVMPSQSWQKLGLCQSVDLSNTEQLQQAQANWPTEQPTPNTVAYITDASQTDNPAAEAHRHLHSLLNLAQANGQWANAPDRHLIITQGANEQDASPLAEALWGMGKCWQLELPHYNVCLIDLDQAAISQPAPWLSQLPLKGRSESQWRLRNKTILVPRLQPWDCQDSPQPIACDAQANYLITGGLGALGLITAQWLIDNGALNLTLIGRSQANDTTQQQLNRWAEQGIQINVHQIDISAADEVHGLFAQLNQGPHPLKGIFHCAGAVADKLLIQQPWAEFESVLSAKTQGTWLLHQASQNLALDYFVCYSSSTAMLGNPGQANYAAANGFMNAIVAQRKQQGLSGLTIHWGPWADVGLAAQLESAHKEHFHKRGITPLSQAQALISFSQLLKQNQNEVMVLDIAWETALQDWPLPLDDGPLAEIAQQISLALNFQKLNHTLINLIHQQTPDQRELLVLRYMETELCQVLNCSELDCDQSVMSMGIDSLMAMEFRSRLKREMALDIPVAELLRGPSVRELSTLVSQQFTEDYFAKVNTDDGSEMVATEDVLDTASWKQQHANTDSARDDADSSAQEIEL